MRFIMTLLRAMFPTKPNSTPSSGQTEDAAVPDMPVGRHGGQDKQPKLFKKENKVHNITSHPIDDDWEEEEEEEEVAYMPKVPALQNWHLVSELDTERLRFAAEPVPQLREQLDPARDYEGEEIEEIEQALGLPECTGRNGRVHVYFYRSLIPVESLEDYDTVRDGLGTQAAIRALERIYSAHRTTRQNVEQMAARGARLLDDVVQELRQERTEWQQEREQWQQEWQQKKADWQQECLGLEAALDDMASDRDAWKDAADSAVETVVVQQQQLETLQQEKAAAEHMLHSMCAGLAERTAEVARLQAELAAVRALLPETSM